MLKCKRCGNKIGKHEVKVSDVTDDYVEVEIECSLCAEVTMWTRIYNNAWIEAN